MPAPGSQTSLREANSQRLLDAVRTYGGITQVELAAATGLSAATVSNIVKQLERDGVLRTSATTRSGRRAQQVSLATTSGLTFGVRLTTRSADVYLADSSHGVQFSQRLPLPPEHRFDTTLDRVALLAGEAVEQVGAGIDDLLCVGVTLPAAPLRPPGSLVPAPPPLPGWEDVDIARTVGQRLNRPVVVEVEAEAAAVAENRFGASRGASCVLQVRVGESTEAALVIDGLVHHGAVGPAGLVGHVQVDPAGAICRCGARGCLNTVTSGAAMAQLLAFSHGPLTLRQIVQAALHGDPGCQQAVTAAGAALGPVVANAAILLGADKVVLGGELAETGDLLLAPVREAVRNRPLLGDADELVVLSTLGWQAEAMGVAALALDLAQLPLPPSSRSNP